MLLVFLSVVAFIASIVLTVILYRKFVSPDSVHKITPGVSGWATFFRFDHLLVENILKALYMFFAFEIAFQCIALIIGVPFGTGHANGRWPIFHVVLRPHHRRGSFGSDPSHRIRVFSAYRSYLEKHHRHSQDDGAGCPSFGSLRYARFTESGNGTGGRSVYGTGGRSIDGAECRSADGGAGLAVPEVWTQQPHWPVLRQVWHEKGVAGIG